VTIVERLTGWKAQVNRVGANALAPYEIDLQAINEHDGIRDRHPFHLRRDRRSWVVCRDSDGSRPTEVSVAAETWYAAMLFAVVPLRNALPGSPAFGSWIDLTIVLWYWWPWWSQCCSISGPGGERHRRPSKTRAAQRAGHRSAVENRCDSALPIPNLRIRTPVLGRRIAADLLRVPQYGQAPVCPLD